MPTEKRIRFRKVCVGHDSNRVEMDSQRDAEEETTHDRRIS